MRRIPPSAKVTVYISVNADRYRTEGDQFRKERDHARQGWNESYHREQKLAKELAKLQTERDQANKERDHTLALSLREKHRVDFFESEYDRMSYHVERL